MSAQEQMRAMLDELMGTGRDGENNKYHVNFSDPRVCKSFLLGCCPHDILAGTRYDLGECQKIHDLALRADYELAAKDHDYYYDIDAMEHLTGFIGDCDKRTEIAKQRLKETQEELSAEVSLKLENVHDCAEEIGQTLAKAELLGAEGKVEESLKMMQEVEDLKKKKFQAENEYRQSMPASNYQQQKLRVCEVCSAYLGIHDNDRRLADHFGGKLHLGFIKIRDKLSDLQKSVAEKREQREVERERRRVEREKEREDERTKRDKDREDRRRRTRSRSRSRRKRSRSKSRDRRRRHRSKSRSRSRSQRKRSRSRSRSRRSRHSRSRSAHSRSRSRDQRKRKHSHSDEERMHASDY